MKILFFSALTLLVSCGSNSQSSTVDEDWPTVHGNADLIVKSIRYSKKSGEFGGTSQFAVIMVQNIGRQYIRSGATKVTVKGQVYSASVYGPSQQTPGQFLLAAPIFPGTQGQLLLYLPDNTIRHCERVSGVIDSEHRLQFGTPSPFTNDSLAAVMAVDTQSIRACADSVVVRP